VLGLLGVMLGLAGTVCIELDPLPVVLDEGFVPLVDPGAGEVPRLLDAGARGGALDESEFEPLSQATSANVASVAPSAMIVFFMVRLSDGDAQQRFCGPLAPWRSPWGNRWKMESLLAGTRPTNRPYQ
jgi:hypothetical protein